MTTHLIANESGLDGAQAGEFVIELTLLASAEMPDHDVLELLLLNLDDFVSELAEAAGSDLADGLAERSRCDKRHPVLCHAGMRVTKAG